MSKILVVVAIVCSSMFTTRLAAADDAVPEPKDRGTAFALSAGGTAVSIGLMVAGMKTGNPKWTGVGLLSSLVTPSAGEIYAGKGFTTTGMDIRMASVGSGSSASWRRRPHSRREWLAAKMTTAVVAAR